MMRMIPAALTALLLSACSSTPKTVYYQVPAAATATTGLQQADASRPALWVDQVTVPDYLAGNGLVYQTSEVKYVIAANNQWASPLDQQLKQVLVSDLSAQLPSRVVSATPLGAHPDQLNVNVTSFQGRYDGRAVIRGDWTLQQGDRVVRRAFALAIPQPEDGYDALVQSLGAGWQQVADGIARQAAQSPAASLTKN